MSTTEGHLIRQAVRERLAAGVLPPAGSRTYAGYGTGKVCCACDLKIGREEVEFDVIGQDWSLTAHAHCYHIWWAESAKAAES